MDKQKQLKSFKKNSRRLQTSLLAGALLTGSIPGLAYAAETTYQGQAMSNDHVPPELAGTKNTLTDPASTDGFSAGEFHDLNGISSLKGKLLKRQRIWACC
ncbi:hypothetical protein [Paenibacillus sp. GCM10027626]|uniref:hypothetical protein n=1 Tax=Paenibacillus sp. GCM10027626 TaxID=3273411 RepID=UPI003625EBDA